MSLSVITGRTTLSGSGCKLSHCCTSTYKLASRRDPRHGACPFVARPARRFSCRSCGQLSGNRVRLILSSTCGSSFPREHMIAVRWLAPVRASLLHSLALLLIALPHLGRARAERGGTGLDLRRRRAAGRQSASQDLSGIGALGRVRRAGRRHRRLSENRRRRRQPHVHRLAPLAAHCAVLEESSRSRDRGDGAAPRERDRRRARARILLRGSHRHRARRARARGWHGARKATRTSSSSRAPAEHMSVSLKSTGTIADSPVQSGDQVNAPDRSWLSRNTALVVSGVTGLALIVVTIIRP